MRIDPYSFGLFISVEEEEAFGVTGVFVFITGAMALVMVCIGLMRRRTPGKSLESISH